MENDGDDFIIDDGTMTYGRTEFWYYIIQCHNRGLPREVHRNVVAAVICPKGNLHWAEPWCLLGAMRRTFVDAPPRIRALVRKVLVVVGIVGLALAYATGTLELLAIPVIAFLLYAVSRIVGFVRLQLLSRELVIPTLEKLRAHILSEVDVGKEFKDKPSIHGAPVW